MPNAKWQSRLWDHRVEFVKFLNLSRTEVLKDSFGNGKRGLDRGCLWREFCCKLFLPLFPHLKPDEKSSLKILVCHSCSFVGRRVAAWTGGWLLAEKCKRQECGPSSWSRVGGMCVLHHHIWSSGERTDLGLFYILSKPGRSIWEPKGEKWAVECWGGAAR